MQALLTLEGDHAHLASPEEVAAGIHAARDVFEQNGADPVACAAASEKLDKDQELTHDEALLCVIWSTADDKAFRAVTLGWLVRDVDIRLSLARAP